MNAPLDNQWIARPASPFGLDDAPTYRRWRDWKLTLCPACADDLVVEIRDPRQLSGAERAALLDRISRANVAVYRAAVGADDPESPRALGAQLGLHRLDANWLADEDGISRIEVSGRRDDRGAFIPYTDRPINWHTDGYYHPPQRRIEAMILHCVRPARSGGMNALLDHEMAYIALRDANPDYIRALMQPDAMLIPERTDDGGVARPAQAGPVFSVGDDGKSLHLRYTARTRSIQWKDEPTLQAALRALESLLASDSPWILRLRLESGMGIVGHNVLHARTAFEDDANAPRLLYRARYLDRIALHQESTPWRNG
jgi:alpha-ketoglutarate-dependent taurine dioxygenase